MSRLREMHIEQLDSVPTPCRECMFWQNDTAGRAGLAGDPAEKDAWWRSVELEWGAPGKAVWLDGEMAGFAMYAPAEFVRRSRTIGPPPSEGALVLMTLWVSPVHRGEGLARALVQATVREAVVHGADAVEAYGVPEPTASGADPVAMGACVVGAHALMALGFRLHRVDVEHPLYRIDTERTARWPGMRAHALGEVIASIAGRERAPAAQRA